MGGEPIGFTVAVIQHLNLDGTQEGLSQRRHGARPNEDTRIASRLQVTPLQLQDEILVLAFSAQRPGGNSIAVDHPVPDGEGLRSTVDVHPAPKITTIEDRFKIGFCVQDRHRGKQHRTKDRNQREA